MASGGWQSIIEKAMFDINSQMLRPIYTWVRFRIRLAHFPKYKNNYNLKNGLAYCKIKWPFQFDPVLVPSVARFGY